MALSLQGYARLPLFRMPGALCGDSARIAKPAQGVKYYGAYIPPTFHGSLRRLEVESVALRTGVTTAACRIATCLGSLFGSVTCLDRSQASAAYKGTTTDRRPPDGGTIDEVSRHGGQAGRPGAGHNRNRKHQHTTAAEQAPAGITSCFAHGRSSGGSGSCSPSRNVAWVLVRVLIWVSRRRGGGLPWWPCLWPGTCRSQAMGVDGLGKQPRSFSSPETHG
ncbi:hypothetical protein EDB80DRAFT_686643 [Ilyonectria destructans]|nr:hypothetical protein EDB80DRAFT_686643 [Ilyonectria destructans]